MLVLFKSVLTNFWWTTKRGEGLVWQKILQVFHDLVGAVRIVPSVFLFIPSLSKKNKARCIKMNRN